jgi:RND family efflux transporter MFP subunit
MSQTVSMLRGRWARLTFAILAVVLLPCIGRAQGGPAAPSVVVAAPLEQRITIWDEFIGRFEAVERVEIRPRVTGFIAEIHFTDGAIVHKGDKLFTIDPRPYEIALDSAKADVERAKAQVHQAELDYDRAQQMVKTSATTVRELDQRKATLDVDRAQQLSAEAALRNAELNLEWTGVTAPITGRISDRKVTVGNLVNGVGEATLLTTIVSLDPIYFVFEASEADYLHYAHLNEQGERPSSRDAPNPVELRLADESKWTHVGHMNFVDNEMVARSGTIRGRAVFDNKDLLLAPGIFGRLRLYGGMQNVLLIPDDAIVSDQAQKIVMTVDAGGKVVPKPVALGSLARGLRAVTGGLSLQDKVIIGGLANPFVRPGAAVLAQPGAITAAPDDNDSLPFGGRPTSAQTDSKKQPPNPGPN